MSTMAEEEFQARRRASMRRDGAGPHEHWYTGPSEYILLDEGESVRDAMRDHPSPVMAYVALEGTEFGQATCSDAPLGEQACYANARQMAKEMREDGWRYVEGWARHAILSDMLVRHAWCMDEDGWAVEVTWDDPSSFYLGVVFDKIPPKREENIAITDGWALKRLAKTTRRGPGFAGPTGPS
jgi:hypothetical protein